MSLSERVLSLLLAAAAAGCTGGRPSAVVSIQPSCDPLAADTLIRRVQQSEAFETALEAIRRLYAGYRDAPLDSGQVATFCRRLRVVTSPTISPLTVVLIPPDLEGRTVNFGVSRDQVVLLNRLQDSVLTDSLDMATWNRFVHPTPPLTPLPDPGQVLTYVCLVYSLAAEQAYPSICDWETSVTVERGDSGAYSVIFPRLLRAVRVTRDREVLELPLR